MSLYLRAVQTCIEWPAVARLAQLQGRLRVLAVSLPSTLPVFWPFVLAIALLLGVLDKIQQQLGITFPMPNIRAGGAEAVCGDLCGVPNLMGHTDPCIVERIGLCLCKVRDQNVAV